MKGRFAPSTTGPAHLGTLLAALLAWLDARKRGIPLILRLEDLDPDRCKPEYAASIVADLAWLGLDWDEVVAQHTLSAQHEAALDALAAAGRLYPCSASREDLRRSGRRTPDGGFAYDNRHRGAKLPVSGWRTSTLPLRVWLPEGRFSPVDEGGEDLSGSPADDFGDPVVRRRDGAVAYQLAVVVDDAAAGVGHIVRGRDIAPSTATQVALLSLLRAEERQLPFGVPARDPTYRHHLLLLERVGEKLAKSRGAVRGRLGSAGEDPKRLSGILAATVGLLPAPEAVSPADLLQGFDWGSVRREDVLLAE